MHPRIQWVLPNASPVLLPERLEWPGQPFLPLRRPIEWDSPESCPYTVSCSKERLIVLLLRQTLPCHFSVYIIHLFSYAPAGYTHLSEIISLPAESPSEIFNFLMCVELYTCFFKMATGISIPIFYQNKFSLCVFRLIQINPHTLHTVCLSSDDPYISSSHGHRCPTGKEEQSGSEWP